ncbi:hypothetical protein FBUS_06832 [Fasciolopsis buskii]|uniref:EGF-like domain-containing protein n=1 Tax=Fasciolopsis buskii TaxID=27845 RepID=A0A8E0VNQ9_9TREM|nr:hypothetical protein FBUS_06832 [Fasciolopsis buski]
MSAFRIPLFIFCSLAISTLISDTQAVFVPRSTNGEYSLRLQYLVRQCVPLCANDGRLYVPDRLWKKCRCVCPRGFEGIACERRVEEHKRFYSSRLDDQVLEPTRLNAGDEQQFYIDEMVLPDVYASPLNKNLQKPITSDSIDH